MEKSLFLNSGQKAELRMAILWQSDKRKTDHHYREAVEVF